MESWQLMMAAGDSLPAHVKPWTMWMQIVLFLGPILFLRYRSAQLLIGAQILNTAVAFAVFVWEGHEVTRLFGLGHFLWLVPAAFFVRDLRQGEASKLYLGFAAVALATISISLLFDTRDTVLWLLGDRGSVLVSQAYLSPAISFPV